MIGHWSRQPQLGLAGAILSAAVLSATGTAIAQAPEAAPRQMVAALHVHTTAGSGANSVSQVARKAFEAGIDIVLLTENFGYKFRYAPAPLRFFAEARSSRSTVEDYGIERFVADIREAQRTRPDVRFLVGAEVIPHYYWTGGLWGGNLTLNNMQRNVLLVVPPAGDGETTDPRAFLEGLPVIGNPYARHFSARSLALLLPGLIIVGLALRGLRRRGALAPSSYAGRYRLDEAAGRYERERPPQRDFRNWMSVALLLIGAGPLYLNFPFSVHDLEPYDPTAGTAINQELFDYADGHGALAFWSMPQAVDYRDLDFGPFPVHLSTHPYPQMLEESDDYTGFGGVYSDSVTLWEAGDVWDEALLSYQGGQRRRPAWLVGETAFHSERHAGKSLGDVISVLLVDEETSEAAFAALAGGHSYAVRRDAGAVDLRLEEFSVARVGGIGGQLPDVGRAGDTLEAVGEFELTIAVDDLGATGTPVRIEVIRNGELHRSVDDTTPVRRGWLEALAAGEEAAYFRVIVRAPRPAYLVSNPIFLKRNR